METDGQFSAFPAGNEAKVGVCEEGAGDGRGSQEPQLTAATAQLTTRCPVY
jgi:hypothetical protein